MLLETPLSKLLETDRITLEPLTAAHATELFPLLADRQIYRFIADEPPVSVAALAERYQRLESRHSPDGSQQWLNWAIRRGDDRQCVGYLQATIYPGGTADFAFVLGSSFWGLGLAKEASIPALQMLFAECGVTFVFATADRRNLRSSGLLARLGFVRVQSAYYPHGDVLDSDHVFQMERLPGVSCTLEIQRFQRREFLGIDDPG
jgi:ribosomal-protein-alanine N-acetyltransferase